MFRRTPGQLIRRVVAVPSATLRPSPSVFATATTATTTALTSSTAIRLYSRGGEGEGSDVANPRGVVAQSYDRFGGERAYEAPAEGEELDLIGGAGTRVPWPEVQRQLQLFVSSAVTDPKGASRGRTFLRDFDVLSNLTSISDGLELLYYMQRLSYPPNSKLEVSLVGWLFDNLPLITSAHVLDMCRFAIEQQSYEFWKRTILLTDAFIPHLMELLARAPEPPAPTKGGKKGPVRRGSNLSAPGDGDGPLGLEDYVLVARVLQHSREEYENAQRKSLMPGVEYAKKRPIFKVIVQRAAEELRAVDGSVAEEGALVTPELVGNVVKHIATLDPSCHAQTNLLEQLEVIFADAAAIDAMRYLSAMSESGAGFPSLLAALVGRIDQHARKALKPPTTTKGKRKLSKKASVRAIRDDPEKHEESEAIVDVTFITRAFLLISKVSRGSDPTIAHQLLLTLRPAVDAIQKILSDRNAGPAETAQRRIRLLADLGGVSDIVDSAAIGPDDAMVVSMRSFLREYTRAIDEAVQQGAVVDGDMLEECGYCLRIASKLLDADLAAEIGKKVEELAGVLVEATTANPSHTQPISLEGALRIVEGLAAVGSFPPKVIDVCVRICLEHRSQLSSKDVSAVIFVAGLCKGAAVDSEAFHQLTSRLLNTAKFRRNDVLGPNAVAQLLRGLAAAGIKPDERLQAFLSDQALRYTSDFSVRDSTSLLIVVHQLGLDQSTVGQRLGLEVAASIPHMNADDLVRLSSVLAELNLRDVCMLDAIGYRLRDCCGELKPRHLTEFAMSLRELNFVTLFAKCSLAELVPAMEGLTPNDASFLMTFCPPPIQETLIARHLNSLAALAQLNAASLITVYGASPDHMQPIRDRALELLVGKECPMTVSADVGCLALCRAINADTAAADRMTDVSSFLAPVAAKFTSTQVEVIVEQLRRVVADAVPEHLRRQNEARELSLDKEDKIAELGKESIVGRSATGGGHKIMSVREHSVAASLRGSTFVIPAPFYRFLGRRLCATVDFLSAETTLAALELYMHGKVRDDKVVKTLFRRLARTHRPIANSPRLTRAALALVDFYTPAWAGGLASVLQAKTTIKTRTLVRTSLAE